MQKYGDGRVALIGVASSPAHVPLCDACAMRQGFDDSGNTATSCDQTQHQCAWE